MKTYDTYAINVRHKLDILKTFDLFEENEVISTSAIWGRSGDVEMIVFRDGNIWISVRPKPDKLRQTMEVVQILNRLLKSEGIDIEASELISSSETVIEDAPSQALMFSKLKEMRPNLRDKMSANIYRLLVHKGLRNLMGERSNAFLEGIGKDIGIAAFTIDEPGDVETAHVKLKKIFEEYGLGMINYARTENASEVARITVKESLTASGLPPTGEAICYMEAGVIEGFLSKFYGKAVSVKEIGCVSMGGYVCTFMVSLFA